MTLREQIAVMQQYDCGKDIQVMLDSTVWIDTKNPSFNWHSYKYRVKPNKFHSLVETITSSEVESTTISFGGIENKFNKELKIVYDTHIRDILTDTLQIGNVVRFKLVPLNDFGEEILAKINESKYAKQ